MFQPNQLIVKEFGWIIPLFNISYNQFNYIITGISVKNSGKYGGSIGPDISGQKNTFNYCYRSIETLSNNKLLQLKCNDCINDPLYASYNVNFYNNGKLANQGYVSTGPFSDRTPAGNNR
ncbi:MAG: hypothetical protein HY738_24110 [Bacteroidia bacterium]|nr:hypothetical protein [Bacteroidia bacterium]